MVLFGECLFFYVFEVLKIYGDEILVILLMGENGSYIVYFWVYLCDGCLSGDMSLFVVVFCFMIGCGGEYFVVYFVGYEGYFQVDGYVGYNMLYCDLKMKVL